MDFDRVEFTSERPLSSPLWNQSFVFSFSQRMRKRRRTAQWLLSLASKRRSVDAGWVLQLTLGLPTATVCVADSSFLNGGISLVLITV